MQQTEKSDARGFTLIELLVVVVVIMILSSLAVSALSRAKNLPNVTDCKNNYRQWGVTCNLYANDDSQRTFPSSLGHTKWSWKKRMGRSDGNDCRSEAVRLDRAHVVLSRPVRATLTTPTRISRTISGSES